jgi:hypothetical protein
MVSTYALHITHQDGPIIPLFFRFSVVRIVLWDIVQLNILFFGKTMVDHTFLCIPHFALALIFFCRRHSVLRLEASIPLLVSIFSLFLTYVVPLSRSLLDQNPSLPLCPLLCCNSIMSRERGQPKRGPTYYNFIA